MKFSEMKNTALVPRRIILLAITFGLFYYNFAVYITWIFKPSVENGMYLTISGLIEFITQWILSFLLIVGLEALRKKGKSLIQLILFGIPLTIIAAVIDIFLTNGLFLLAGRIIDPISLDYLRVAAYYLVPLTFILAIYGALIAIYEARHLQEQALVSDRMLQEAKWQMLRYQVNPHFLFNALNTIRSMLDPKEKNARKIVTELSDYFRFSLNENTTGTIELTKEVAAVQNYLEIQRLRFEQKLHYSVHLDPQIEHCKIPIFCIQTLVENGVKYGAKTNGFPLNIDINASTAAGNLLIRVSNSGSIFENASIEDEESAESTKTGLTNLKTRLELFYGKKASFSIREENMMVIATIRIPLNFCYETMEGNHN